MYDPLNVYRGRYKEFIENHLEYHPEYLERGDNTSYHHVIPECCGGTNDEENLYLYLPHKEHFIAHRILSEDNPHIKGLQ